MGKKKNKKIGYENNLKVVENNSDVVNKDDSNQLHHINTSSSDSIYTSVSETHHDKSHKGFRKCIRDASKEFDEMVGEKYHSENSRSVKKSKARIIMKELLSVLSVALLFVVIYVASMFLKTVNTNKNIVNNSIECVKDSIYQYEPMDAEDFIFINEEGKKYSLLELPEGYSYEFISPTYRNSETGVMVNNHVYVVNTDIIEADSIYWKYTGKNKLSKDNIRLLSKENLVGTIVYEDGVEKSLSADKIEVFCEPGNESNVTVLIYQGDNKFSWNPNLEE